MFQNISALTWPVDDSNMKDCRQDSRQMLEGSSAAAGPAIQLLLLRLSAQTIVAAIIHHSQASNWVVDGPYHHRLPAEQASDTLFRCSF
jgi:hypothetical protein